MNGIAIALILFAGSLLLPLQANGAAVMNAGKTSSSQVIDLQRIGTQMDGIQDPASKKKALELLGDHQDLLTKVKQGGLENLIKHGIARNVKQRRSTPTFQVKGERTDTSTTVTFYQTGAICLSRPEIEVYIHQSTAQLRILIARFNNHSARIVLWDDQGRIKKNEIIKENVKEVSSKELKIVWPTLPIQVNTQDAGDQQKKIEETVALVNEVITLIKNMQGVVKYKLSMDRRYFAELDGWGKIKQIRFALEKNTPVSWELGSVHIDLAGSDIDAISVQFDPFIVDEIKDGEHIWWFRCDPAGKVIFVDKTP